MEPLAAQMFSALEPVAEVFGQGFPEFGEFTVRVAVEPGGGLGHGRGDGRPDIGRDAMGVLVDVEQDGNVQLRGAVGAQSPQVGPKGQSVQSLKLVSHLEQFK